MKTDKEDFKRRLNTKHIQQFKTPEDLMIESLQSQLADGKRLLIEQIELTSQRTRVAIDLQAKLAAMTKQRDALLAALERMNRAYVNLLENGRDRIISLGGSCDPVDVMEHGDLNLRESRVAIANVKGEV